MVMQTSHKLCIGLKEYKILEFIINKVRVFKNYLKHEKYYYIL